MSNDPQNPVDHKDSTSLALTEEKLTNNFDDERLKIKNRTSLMVLELVSHTLILGLALGSIYLVHLILERLLGHDAKFFDLIPVRWIIDVADIVVIGKFLWEVLKGFREKK